MTTPAPDINSLLDQLREQWLEVVRERDELREVAKDADALIVKLYDEDVIPTLMQYEVDGLRSRIHKLTKDQNRRSE